MQQVDLRIVQVRVAILIQLSVDLAQITAPVWMNGETND